MPSNIPTSGGQRTSGARTRNASGRSSSSLGSFSSRAPKNMTIRGVHTRRKRSFLILAGSIIAAIIVLSALLWWINRPVTVTIDGEETQVRVGSTLDEVFDAKKIEVRPGDYVSVSDNVIKAGMGRRFSATLNGKKLSAKKSDELRIKGGENLEFGNGDNVTEDFTYESEPIIPYLRMEGTGYTLQYISQWGYAGELQHRVGKDSGHKADVVVKEATDCVITCIDPYIDGDKKLVALTFDDGPSSYTDEYLQILEKYGVKATFFNLGDNVLQYPDVAKRVVEAGHQLCNHTMAHNQLTAVEGGVVYNEITRSAAVIEEATGILTTHLRPPYGDFTEQSWLGSGGSVTASIRWTGDSQDWALPGVDAMVSNALLYLHSGSIILMHDGGGDRSQDVEALPKLIEQVQSEGYEFVTIADLMRAQGNIPEDICSGTGTMPKDAVWPNEVAPEDLVATQQDD
ncbi:MAG: polysaccharide deacetylase family protein [Coriobacteriales bacterium]|nr:polysaccharide deacetylase family protein [Coriobacteriales bacterium]